MKVESGEWKVDEIDYMVKSIGMTKPGPLRSKSYAFAVSIVLLCKKLQKEREFVICDQLLKSGTSVGANIEEANQGQSRKDFVAKLSISLKEAHETHFWLRLLVDTLPIHSDVAKILMKDLQEIIALLTSIIKTTKQSL